MFNDLIPLNLLQCDTNRMCYDSIPDNRLQYYTDVINNDSVTLNLLQYDRNLMCYDTVPSNLLQYDMIIMSHVPSISGGQFDLLVLFKS